MPAPSFVPLPNASKSSKIKSCRIRASKRVRPIFEFPILNFAAQIEQMFTRVLHSMWLPEIY